MSNLFVQRARKPNYTKEETEMLLDQLIIYGHFLFNKTQLVNNQQKADVWANIAMQVNSVPNSAGRTVDELKHRWQDMAQRARAAIRKGQTESSNSNGKNVPSKPVPFLDKIMHILGESQRDGSKKQEELVPISLDSTYSSDSSCTNEGRQAIKEENNIQDAVVDLSQSNGSKTNSRKRPNLDTVSLTSKSNQAEISADNPPFDKTNISSLQSGSDVLPSTSLYFTNSNQDGSKRRKTRDVPSPGKFTSSLSDQNNSPLNGQQSRHHHTESSRSMVLDPESQLVMEVEDFGGDERSASSSRSASNLSIHDGENHYEDASIEDKANVLPSRPLQSEPSFSSVHPFLTTANSINLRSILSRKPVPSQPFRMDTSFTPPLYHLGSQNLAFPHIQLDSLPKVELERQCIISQIKMQDQQTQYFLLKEKKLQLEIDLLKQKCSCNNTSSANRGMDHTSSSTFKPSNTITSPCHLSISEVTSCRANDLKDQSEASQQTDHGKTIDGDGIEIEQEPLDLVSQSFESYKDDNFENKKNEVINCEEKDSSEPEKLHSPPYSSTNDKKMIKQEKQPGDLEFKDEYEKGKLPNDESGKDWEKALRESMGL